MSQPKVANPPCRLYLISPPSIDLDLFAAELAAALAAGDVACFQLRLKDATDDQIRAAAEALIPICHDRDVAFILNDRPDLAAAIGADGVHIGQQDTDYATARTLLGADKIVGVTCHDSRHLAMLAGEAGADYVAFGAFYDTSTKALKTRADPEILKWWSTFMEIPCVAIGGITIENCGVIIKTGADFIAVSSGVWDCGTGPGAAVKEFNQILGQSATTETT